MVPTKSLECQLLINLENETWYPSNARTQHLNPIVSYDNYLICIFIIINENFTISNQRKITQTLRGRCI